MEIAVRVYTHNIRYKPLSLEDNELPWKDREPFVVRSIDFNTRRRCSFVCLQEALLEQLLDVQTSLGIGEWAYVGAGRDDGREAGEYSPIFYRPLEFELVRGRTTWLSPTPLVPSKGWDAACVRILTTAEFIHKATGREVAVMNTHLDHQGSLARRKAAEMILKEAQRLAESGKAPGTRPVVLTGDFNSTANGGAYKVLTGSGGGGRQPPLRDVREEVQVEERYGNVNTFTGFGGKGGEPPERIDFIFLGRHDQVTVDGYGVLENRFEDGVYASDHRPVVGDILIRSNA